MGIRCEVCDNYLSVFQLSRLCEYCYKVRTIAKCYSSEEVLDCLEKNFKVDYMTRSKSLPTINEEKLEKPSAYKNVNTSVPIPSNETIIPENFRKELEDKVVKQIETRQQKHKKK